MILPHAYPAILAVMILSLLCLGSWANAYKLTGKWRFELFYFDYALGVLLASLILAYTFGSLGVDMARGPDGFSFWDDLMHAGKRQWMWGFLGGMVFNFGNMLLVSAISVSGMAVAFPVGMGLALVVGVGLTYLTGPAGDPALLAAGCALIAGAIVVDALAHRALSLKRHEEEAKAGQAKSTRRPASIKAILLALSGGLMMGLFLPLVRKATAGEVGLGPYAVCVVFAGGMFFSSFVFNMFFMNLPVEGDPVGLFDYFKGKPKQHILGILGGVVWGTGTVAGFVAASANAENIDALMPGSAAPVGPGVAYAMGHGAALVAALWGILAWREFKGSDSKIKALAGLMLLLFAAGLAALALAPLYARPS